MMPTSDGRGAQRHRPFFLIVASAALLLLVLFANRGHAMWAQMSDTDLVRHSDWVVLGEWAGQGVLRTGRDAEAGMLGVITVSEVLKGPPNAGLAFVALPSPSRPVSSSDLRFQRGDRGLWLLRHQTAGDPTSPLLIDHPQRFVRETPANATTIAALRKLAAPR